MIAPINFQSPISTTLTNKTSFKGKNVKQMPKLEGNFYTLKSIYLTKITLGSIIFDKMASLFGKKFVFDEATANLSRIDKFSKGKLQQSIHYFPEGKKVKEIDDYKNGKLSKMSAFRSDGKTLDWTIEYLGDRDVTTFYQSDGIAKKEVQTEFMDGSGLIQTKYFDKSQRVINKKEYVNDSLINEYKYFDDKNIELSYENGKLTKKVIEYKRRGDSIETIYDKNGNRQKIILYKLDKNGKKYISSVEEYRRFC